MPELPEVETTRRGLAPHVVGRRIARLDVRQPRLRWPVPATLAAFVEGRTITGTARRGKYLLLQLDGAPASADAGVAEAAAGYGAAGTAAVAATFVPGDTARPDQLIVHLGMSGRFFVLPADQPLLKHDHLDLVLEAADGAPPLLLRFHDPRRFGAVLPWPAAEPDHALIRTMGPEPFSAAFDGDYLHRLSRGKTAAVKTFLMDGGVVVGAGNIYAAESLFRAGIRPTRPAGNVTRPQYRRLADRVREVLAEAIEDGGTTLRDFAGADGRHGHFQRRLFVYGREGEACHVCRTTIRGTRLGNRQSCWCPTCQK